MTTASAPKIDSITAADIAQSLGGRKTPNGYSAHCPAHEDRHASLSIAEGNGQILFKCHAGCSQESVLRSLRQRGLWPLSHSGHWRDNSIISYTYVDEAGNPLHRVCRTPKKRFFQEHFDGTRWIRGVGRRTVLYHLDELVTRVEEPVWIAEGEKDVDRLRESGRLVTCNPMGAGKWKDEYSETLSGRDTCVFYDDDPPIKNFAGQIHAAEVALSWARAGCPVRIIKPPYGKDVSEYLEKGGSVLELERLADSARILNVIDILNWKSRFLTPSSTKKAIARVLSPGATYEIREDGVYWRKGDSESEQSLMRLSSRIAVIARTRDAQGGSWGLLLEWQNAEGKSKSWVMPMSLPSGDGSEIGRHLRDEGLPYLTTNSNLRARFLDYLQLANPGKFAQCTTRTGWHGNSFVLPDRTIRQTGSTDEEILFQQDSDYRHYLTTAGTLDRWQAEVGSKCSGNSRLILAVSIALAGPILGLAGAESGGFHLYSSSSVGKTTALVVAGSVLGGGGERVSLR